MRADPLRSAGHTRTNCRDRSRRAAIARQDVAGAVRMDAQGTPSVRRGRPAPWERPGARARGTTGWELRSTRTARNAEKATRAIWRGSIVALDDLTQVFSAMLLKLPTRKS